jgi:hypothetical protein
MHLRDTTKKKADITGDHELLEEYKRLRNKVNRDIKKSQKASMEHLVVTRRKNPIKFWKDVTSIMPTKINTTSIPKNLSLDDINKYFATIGGITINQASSRKKTDEMPGK